MQWGAVDDSLSDQSVHLEYRQQHCHDDHKDEEAHHDDQKWAEQSDQQRPSSNPARVPGSWRRARACVRARRSPRRSEIRCTVIGGNSSGLQRAADRRALAHALRRLVTASRIGRLVTTSPAMRSASRTGTALAVRMLNVRVKRAVLRPRVSRPTSGTRSRKRGSGAGYRVLEPVNECRRWRATMPTTR